MDGLGENREMVSRHYRPASQDEEPGPILSPEEIATTVERYLPLVANQVDRLWLSPKIGLTREDLISAGCYGLLLAARRFDPTRGVGFGVFARSHVHGALMREINVAIDAAGARSDDTLATNDDTIDIDAIPDEQTGAPIDSAQVKEIRSLMECLLTESERLSLTLYFYEELTIAEIAAVTETSPSTAVRTIKRAIGKLKHALKEQ
ncbi:MAG TPA: sigma-70 family RNA polymerase sigma factor [Candidatus Binataceae bacterium]|nr:sigma-70 family RNA polymerase sigma factor [Candidatus Binataceae bacterium]